MTLSPLHLPSISPPSRLHLVTRFHSGAGVAAQKVVGLAGIHFLRTWDNPSGEHEHERRQTRRIRSRRLRGGARPGDPASLVIGHTVLCTPDLQPARHTTHHPFPLSPCALSPPAVIEPLLLPKCSISSGPFRTQCNQLGAAYPLPPFRPLNSSSPDCRRSKRHHDRSRWGCDKLSPDLRPSV